MNWDRIFYAVFGSSGRMLGSKSMYRMDHPHHLVFFNAMIYVNKKRIWCGDLDLTKDEEALVKLSGLHPTAEIIVLSENCARTSGFSSEPTFLDYLLLLKKGEVTPREDFFRFQGKLFNRSVAS